MTDILILYEHKAREIENCALLSVELERRGYKVKVINIYSPIKYFVKAKVVVVPHLYNELQVEQFVENFWLSNKCVIDLQYEQLLAKNSLLDDIHNPKGQAINAQHIAWGKEQAERYLSCGIKQENIHQIGSISMDLLRDEFREYFYNKGEIAKLFNLNPNKKWYLFVSTFSVINRSKAEIDRWQLLDPNTIDFVQWSEESYKIIIDWLKCAALQNPDKVFIYRPHPIERTDKSIAAIVKECDNFKCIGDMTMRQWAVVSDKIYNWYSTSISDIYFANKPCGLLRPVPIPDNLDIDVFDGINKITTKDDFLNTIDNEDLLVGPAANSIEYHYGGKNGPMAYLKIADLCEDFIRGKRDGFHYKFGSSRWGFSKNKNIGTILHIYVNRFLTLVCMFFKITPHKCLPQKWQNKLLMFQKEIYGAEIELNKYKERFDPIVRKIS